MPRKPRLNVPGGLYHVILRGNGRQDIFFDADDRQRWESLIAQAIDRYGHRIHAYCWMTNHVHMAVQCHADPLASFVRFVAGGYARSTNKKLGRGGHLFERRYRATLVEADAYLLQLVRYIHRNPVRAGLVDDLCCYRWSSHLAYCSGLGPEWLTLDWALEMFGNTRDCARRNYQCFMAESDSAGLEARFSSEPQLSKGQSGDHRFIGTDDFATSMNQASKSKQASRSLMDLADNLCREHGTTVDELRSRSRRQKLARIRAELAVLAIDRRVATNAEVARFLGRSEASLSRAAWRVRRQRKQGSSQR